jgi:hypothetical protein
MSSIFITDQAQPSDIGVHENAETAPDTRPWQERLLAGLGMWFDLGVKLGGQLDAMSEQNRKVWDRLQRFTPIDYQTQASGVAVAATPMVLNLGSPDRGTYWELENLIIGGLDVNVAAAGTAGLYVAAQVPTIGGTALIGHGGLTNAQDFATALPYKNFYGRRDVIVLDTEWLYVVIFGGTVAQQYAAEASMTAFSIVGAGGREVTID